MGHIIYFEDHHPGSVNVGRDRELGRESERSAEAERHGDRPDSLIPLQLALDECDIEKCFGQLANYGRCSVVPRGNPADAGKILFLIRIQDAIELNRYLIEQDDADGEDMVRRMDHIQMLENSQDSMLARAWDKIGLEAKVSFSNQSGAVPVDHVRQ